MFGATVTQWVTRAGIPFSEVDTSQLWTLHSRIATNQLSGRSILVVVQGAESGKSRVQSKVA